MSVIKTTLRGAIWLAALVIPMVALVIGAVWLLHGWAVLVMFIVAIAVFSYMIGAARNQ